MAKNISRHYVASRTILELFYFVMWLSDALLEFNSGSQGLTNKFSSRPSVERLIMSYSSEDLILVLKSLFDFTQKPDLAGSANWEVLKEAFEAYAHGSRDAQKKNTHNFCRLAWQQNNRTFPLDRDSFRAKIRELVGQV